MAKLRINNKLISENLRKLANEVHDMDPDGEMFTRAESLARMVWRRALGWKEMTKDDNGKDKEVAHKPETWAIQLVLERMEGKAPSAVEDSEGRITVAERVSELAKKRVNDLTAMAVGPSKRKGPPKRKRHGQ